MRVSQRFATELAQEPKPESCQSRSKLAQLWRVRQYSARLISLIQIMQGIGQGRPLSLLSVINGSRMTDYPSL